MLWLKNHATHFLRAPDGAAAGAGDGGGGQGGAGQGGAGAGAGAAKPWFDGIDAETIGHWDNKGWKKDDPKGLATELTKAWKTLERSIGVPPEQLLKLPKDASDEAGWNTVYERLGRPKEAKEYDLSGLKYGDGQEVEAAFLDTIRSSLFKAGVRKDAVRQVAEDLIKYSDGNEAADSAERTAFLKAEREALQRDWGPNYELNRLNAMQGARRAVGSDDKAAAVVAAMEQAIGYRETMEFWRRIGAGTSEDTFHGGSTNGMSPTTVNGAIARKAELMADKAFSTRYLAGEAAAVREMNNLLLLISGSAA